MGKLTKAQRQFLEAASHPDGAPAYDGREERTGRILAARGLVTIPEKIFGYSLHRVASAHITDAGRRALSPHGEAE